MTQAVRRIELVIRKKKGGGWWERGLFLVNGGMDESRLLGWAQQSK